MSLKNYVNHKEFTFNLSDLFDIHISRSKFLKTRFSITFIGFTFDWVGYDYVRIGTYGIQRRIRLHYWNPLKLNSSIFYGLSIKEFRIGKLIPL